MSTKIEWTDATWNPITGCSKVSPGCKNCYAARMAKRLAGRFGYPADDPFRVTLHEDRLDAPLRWRKPRRAFVCSMGDLFHHDVPGEWIADVYSVMHEMSSVGHVFQVLTKRADRMMRAVSALVGGDVPPPGIWLGVSVENNDQRHRIDHLLDTPAAARFVSVEPMLGPVGLLDWIPDTHDGHPDPRGGPWISWVICGAETGPGARPMERWWARDLRDQCKAAGVPFFFKRGSDGSRRLDGLMYEEMPRPPPFCPPR